MPKPTRKKTELPSKTRREEQGIEMPGTTGLPAGLQQGLGKRNFLKKLQQPCQEPDKKIALEVAANLKNSLPLLGAPANNEALTGLLFSGFLGPPENIAHFLGWFWRLRNCTAERRAMERAAQAYQAAEQAVQQAQQDLDAAEQARIRAVQAASKAARDVQSALDAQRDTLLEFPFNILSSLYLAAFRQAERRANDNLQNAMQRERNAAEMLRLREAQRDAALRAYLDALAAWIRCLFGF